MTTHIPTILVTGGAGYIGSHTMVELLASGCDVICVDNFSNSSPEAVKRVEKIAGKKVTLVNGDVRDRLVLSRVFQRPVDGVIHFAALKAVGESVERPVDYYDNNIGSALALLQAQVPHQGDARSLVIDQLSRLFEAYAAGTVTLPSALRSADLPLLSSHTTARPSLRLGHSQASFTSSAYVRLTSVPAIST